MDENPQIGLIPDYQTYERQKCFLAYSEGAFWSVDLKNACERALKPFNLEMDYATKHFDPDVYLHEKARQLIANARCGIYDLSYWKSDGTWQVPRNVFIELGMAIALNRPALMLRHSSNHDLPLPECLKSIARQIIEWSGDPTLEEKLNDLLPVWLKALPELDWWDRFCKFGNRKCEYREAHPRSRQWGRKELRCHISDSNDLDRANFRKVVETVLERYADVKFTYLDSLPIEQGYEFLLCSHCQTVRSTSFAIYRITPNTPPETFIAIGIILALEEQFEYRIPKLMLTTNKDQIPSLLSGYEVVEAVNDADLKDRLSRFMPKVIQKVRRAVWAPKSLPFIDVDPARVMFPESVPDQSHQAQVQSLIESGETLERAGETGRATESYKSALEIDPRNVSIMVRLAEALVKTGRFQEAELCFKDAEALDPGNLVVLSGLADVLSKMQRYNDAIKQFERAISIDPNALAPRIGLAEVAKASGQYERAERSYRDLIALSPNDVMVRLGWADMQFRQKKYQEAAQTYRDVVETFPDNIVAIGGLAETLRHLHLYEEAEQTYRDAIERFPDNVVVRNGLAQLLISQRRRRAAEEVYRETLELFPGDRQAKAGLTELLDWLSSTRKVRLYDLAKELKIDTKRLIEEVRREGVDISVPSNSISQTLAEKIRDKYFPKKDTRAKRAIRVVKRAARPVVEEPSPPAEAVPSVRVRKLTPRPVASEVPVVATEAGDPPFDSVKTIADENQPSASNATLYVGNLHFGATEADLRNIFSQVGTVRSASISENRVTGRSRGYGFVEMSTVEEAENAILRLSNTELMGRSLAISKARPKRKKN